MISVKNEKNDWFQFFRLSIVSHTHQNNMITSVQDKLVNVQYNTCICCSSSILLCSVGLRSDSPLSLLHAAAVCWCCHHQTQRFSASRALVLPSAQLPASPSYTCMVRRQVCIVTITSYCMGCIRRILCIVYMQ